MMKEKEKRLSNAVKPEGMDAAEWQRALRRQFAAREVLSISPNGEEAAYGVFDVRNPKSKNWYKVVYRGADSRWNYCSCMDYKTNQLGTCKHIEAVRLWLENHGRKIQAVNPPYSSLYVSYRDGRKIFLRIGSAHWDEMGALSKKYFTKDLELIENTIPSIQKFISEAKVIDPDFKCYPDVLDYLAEKKDAEYREQYLSKVTDEDMAGLLKARLYPYQAEGIRFAFAKGKSIIADEMGLGKTIQAIGTAELMRKAGLVSSVLILCPASLKYQWLEEINKFTDSDAVVVEGLPMKRKELYESGTFYKIVSYNAMSNDVKMFGKMFTELLIMDEVQRLKNWNTQISKAARHIQSDYAVVLSGTPLENKLEELYSVMEFVDQYCLGPYYKFIEETTVKDDSGKIISYKNLNKVGEKLSGRLIRRRKSEVSVQMPERTDQNLFVPLTPKQRELHDEFKTGVAQLVYKWRRMHYLSDIDRKRMLLLLSQMRMVCDSTYILDQETRYDTKVDETLNILQNVIASGDGKVVIFSQWERMMRLVATELDKLGIGYSALSGSVPSEKRKALMDEFWGNPDCRVFLSTDAGSTGLNLQIASLIINLDLPWNPAVLEQRIGRIYRIGQKRNIQVINMISKDSFEERMLATLDFKASLSDGILDGGDDTVILDDNKMNKLMDTVTEFVEESGQKGVGSMPMDSEVLQGEAVATAPEDVSVAEVPDMEQPDEESAEETESYNPEKLVEKGVEFLSGLAETLKSPEKTARLVNSIVHTDPESGRQELRIPLPGKDTVESILGLVAKIMSK